MVPGYGGEPTKAKMGPEHVVLSFISTISVPFNSSPYSYSKVFCIPSNKFTAAFSIKNRALTGGQ